MFYRFFYSAGCCTPKIQEGIKGRKRVFSELTDQLQTARPLKKTAWFHFTSVGEFEQAKPLIEAIHAETRIVFNLLLTVSRAKREILSLRRCRRLPSVGYTAQRENA